MARVTKIGKIQTGEFQQEGKDKPTRELTEICTVVEFDDGKGNTYHKLKIPAHLLNPALYACVKPFMQKGAGSVWVNLYDVTRRVKDDSAPEGDEEAERMPF